MNNIWKRSLSLFLAFVMVIGMVPVNAFAAENDVEAAADVPAVEEVLETETEAAETEAPAAPETEPSEPETEPESSETEPEASETEPAASETEAEATETEAAESEATEPEATETEAAEPEASETEVVEEEEEEFFIIEELEADAEAADATSGDGWYWSDDLSTLYIKDGNITGSALYEALYGLFGNYPANACTGDAHGNKYTGYYNCGGGDYRYGNAGIGTLDTYKTWGTAVTSNDSSVHGFSDNTTVYVYRYTGHTDTLNVYYAEKEGKSFTVKHYYNPTVTVSGKDDVTATLSADKVISGESVTVTVSAAGEEGWTATVAGETKSLSATASTTFSVEVDSVDVASIAVKVEKAPTYKITVEEVNGDWGEVEIASEQGIANAEVALTVTTKATDSATYSYTVAVTNGSYDASTGKVTVAGTGDVTVTVTFSKSELEVNSEPKLEINGYHTSTDYSARFTDIKKNILNAVLKNGYTNIDDYNLHVWIDPVAGDARYFDYDDDSTFGDYNLLTVTNPYRFPCADFGDTVFATNLKVKIIDKAGRTVESTIAVTEWRKPATITPGSIGSATFNNMDGFLAGIKNNMTVVDRNNNNIDKSNVTVSDPVKNEDGTYTVTAQVTEAGATWLPSKVVTMGPYTFKYTQYTVKFVDHEDNEMCSYQLDNESVPEYKGTTDMTAYYNAKDTAEWNYTFTGWTPEVSALNGADVTYTATYTQEKQKYTYTFYDEDGKTVLKSETVDYGTAIVAPADPTKAATAEWTYTFAGWDSTVAATVTENVTYKATYTAAKNSYTVTFADHDGDVIKSSTLEYGSVIGAPADPVRDNDVDADGNIMATYAFNGWDKTVAATVTGDVTYTAQYTKTVATYTVTWSVDGVETSETKAYGAEIAQPANPTKEGYGFDGWLIGDAKVTFPHKLVKNVTITAKFVEAVAKIGDVYYTSLADAISAANAGDTVLLLKDVDSVPTINKAITIEGAGDGVEINDYIAENFPNIDGTVTFKNLTFNNRISTENASTDQSKMTLKFVNCTFNVPAENTYAIQAGASWNNDVLGGLVIEDCTFTTSATAFTKGYMVYAQCVKSVSITGSTFDGNEVYRGAIHTGDSTDYATVATISGNTFKNFARGVQVGNRVTGSVVTINNNTFENIAEIPGEDKSATLYIHEVANADALTVNYDGNKTGNSLVIFSENATGTIKEFVEFGENNTANNQKLYMNSVGFVTPIRYTVTFVYGNGAANTVYTVIQGDSFETPADPTWEAHLFAGWDKTITTTPTASATYTAKWNDDADKDSEIDGSDADPYWTVIVDGATVSTTTLNGEYATPAAPADQANKFFIKWSEDVDGTARTITFTSVWNTNDANDNNVDDGSETGTVTLVKEGNGNVTLTPAGNATLIKQDGNVYTYLYDSTDAANKVINVSTSLTDTDATDGNVDYLISAPATVNIGETVTVKFGTASVNASNGTVKINKYYTDKSDKAALATLRTDILKAAGLDANGGYVVTAIVGVQSVGAWATSTVQIKDGSVTVVDGINLGASVAASTLANELNKSSYNFVITLPASGNVPEVSKSVTMQMTDSRPSAGLEDREITAVKVLNDQQGLTDYVNSLLTDKTLNPNSVTVTVSENPVEGSWPPAQAGVTTKLVYTVTYADSADYIGDSAKLTIYVQSAYNNCTVVADSTLTAGGSLTVSPSNDNTTVAGNDTVTITVTPSGSNVVETITVTKNGTEAVTISAISYSNKAATVTFKSDGSTKADEYVVSATYSQNYLNLKADQTIVYCVDDKNHTYDLQKMVFDAIFGGSSAPMTKDNTKLEFKYGHVVVDLWADVSKDPAIDINGISHKFGEDGSETIKLTYSDDKYGKFEQTVELNVFDSCYNVTVGVETVTNGANATIKTQYSEDARTYKNVAYFKQGTSLTVTLTPDGDLLNTLEQMYNGTYADQMAYIKSVTVYDKDGKVDTTLTRGQGELSLDNIISGVNPMLYNAAVTFDLAADEAYKIVVEYGILKLEKKNDDFQMAMYKGGKDYAAEVPSAQELINAILGKAEAVAFLETYGGAYTVEFSTDLINYSWTAVSDEALLALNDGTEIVVRVTWKAADGDKTYYPVAVTANVTLVDLRTPTSVAGAVPTEAVEYVEQDQLIAELKEALGLAINANGAAIEVDYTVTYTITGDEENGYFADVTVTYDGSADYKPTSKTFEKVPIADIPDNATIKVTIQNASDVITNNDGKIQSLDPATGIYTVIGNGTYNFKFTPVSGKAIESVTVNGEAVELAYAKGVTTFSMMLAEKEHYEVVVETVDSVWVLEDERLYDFAYGVMDPVNKDIVDAAAKEPTADAIDYSKVAIEYQARAEGTVTVELPDIDLGFTIIELGTFDIDLGELWLDPNAEVTEYDMEKLLDELVAEVIDKVSHGQLAATDAVSYMTEKLQGLTIGAHAFGSAGDGSTETIRISYADDKYTLAEVVTDVTIHDYRTKTELDASDCSVTYGYSLAQLIAASGAQVTADGAAVSGLTIETNDLYLHANTEAQQVTLTFAGDVNYQPCETTINVIVNKATASIDYDSQMITYGDEYDFALSVSPKTMPDGTAAEIDMIEFMIGLDMHTLLDVDIEDKTVGLDQSIAYIQLRLPQSIRELPLVGQYLQGEFTLSEFTDLINSLSDVLGIDESSMETLNQVVEAITGITDSMEIKIIVKDEDFHPTNIGVYIAGAVTVDSDFETAYTADYLIIAPKTIESELAWDYEDENGIMTLPAYQEVFADLMGAHVVENAETGMTGETLATANGHVKYLILGINDETSEFLYTDVYGNIKANIWTSNDAITDNGAYVQIAYMLNWGNEIYYAMPIVRSFVIVPQTVDVQLVGATGEANNDLLKEFNNEPQGFSVKVTNSAGELIYSDHYQDAVNKLSEYDELTVTYVGLQTNTQTYNSTEKPVHAGAYGVVATLVQKDADGNILAVGMDTGVLVIEPTESTINVEDVIVEYKDTNRNIAELLKIQTGSTVAGLEPDTTIITASIAANGDFSENGWEAVDGAVNVDFPDWVDEMVIAEYMPSIQDGITVGELKEKIASKLPEITAKLAELGATEEVINSLTNLMNSVTDVLADVPSDVELTFADTDTLTAKSVGAYVVIGVVTDSDHYPSVDAGALVIVPAVDLVHLKWNHEDENNVWTRELLEHVDLLATAYDDPAYTIENEEATAKITYQYIGVDKTGELIVMSTTNPDELPNGVYIELAYIELEVAGEMVISDMIAREIVIVPGVAEVKFVDETGAENADRIFIFDNTGKTMPVQITINGEVVDPAEGELTFTYAGVQTNGKEYFSTTAPKHAGIYTVTATYVDYTSEGSLAHMGAAVGVMAIEPAESSIEVTGGTVTYDGYGHTASVVATGAGVNPDYTLISGGVYVSGDIDEIGVDAFHGNVNIDFPSWLDEALAEHEFKTEGVDTAYLIDFIGSYRDDLIELIPVEELVALEIITEEEINAYIEKLNGYIDELLTVLNNLPKDVALTFNDGVTYTEPGYYFYYGIVTDSDHYPSTDTGLLVIEKMDAMFGAWHEVVPYDGEEHTVYVPNDYVNVEGAPTMDYITMVVNREDNSVNIILDEDLMYVMDTVERILGIEIPKTITIEDLIDLLDTVGLNVDDFANALVSVIDALLNDMEMPEPGTKEYAQSTYRDLVNIKDVLLNLPKDGTITINGALPVEVGAYEFYIFGWSQYYKSVDASAVLFIEPIRVVVDDEADSKVYGESDPEELPATVKYYSIVGREDPYTWEDKTDGKYAEDYVGYDDGNFVRIVYETVEIEKLPEGIELTYEVTRELAGTEEGENVGTYDMQVENAFVTDTKNCVLEVVEDDTVFTITPAAIFSVEVTSTHVYDSTEQTAKVVVKNDKGEELTEGTDYVIISGNTGKDAGTYTVKVKGINNYAEELTADWTIAKANVIINIINDEITYGEATPAVEVKVSGDPIDNAELNLDYKWNAPETNANVGTYTFTFIVNTSKNWIVTYVGGKLTVNPAELPDAVVTGEYTYNGQNQTATVMIDGLEEGVDFKIVSGGVEKNAGTYTVTVEGIGNYAGTKTADWTIAKKAATITANDKTMVAGGTVPALDATVEGVVEGETLNYTLSTVESVAIGEHGTYPIKVTLGENPNYDVTAVNGTLTAVECVVTVDGVPYASWEEANDAIERDSKIKLYADITYAPGTNGNDVQSRFTGNTELDLNGYDLAMKVTWTVSGSMHITGDGSLTMMHEGWPLVLSGSKVYLDSDVEFTGSMQFSGGKGDLYIGDEAALGQNGKYQTGNETWVRVHFANGLLDLNFSHGNITLTESDTTLENQNITIGKDAKFTVAENVVLTLDPTTDLTINGTVDGAGTVALSTVEHLKQVLVTDVENVKLVGSDADTAADLVSNGNVTVDLNKQSMTVGSLTVNGNMIIKDTASGDAQADAGKLLGTITVADGASLTLYAGTYSQDVEEYCADGYYAHDNGNGTWTVLKEIKIVSAVVNDELIYNSKAQTPVNITVTDENGNVVDSTKYNVVVEAQTDAGTYTLKVEANDRAYNGTVENVEWTIAKAKVAVMINDQTIDVDDEVPTTFVKDTDYNVTVEVPGAVTDEELGLKISVNVDKNSVGQNVIGTYDIVADYTESENYDVEVTKGTLTVELGDYVCWNMQTGVYYHDVGVGLTAAADGETVQMLKDDVCDNMLLWAKKGTTLDLNGLEVKADYVIFVNGSDLVDNSASNAGLLIPNLQCTLAVDNDQVPIYDDELDGYVFAVFQIDTPVYKYDEAADTIRIEFTAYIETKNGFYKKYFGDGVDDNLLSIAVQGTWIKDDGYVTQNFAYLEDTVIKVVNSKNYGLRYYLVLKNVSQYLANGDITLTGTIQSQTGAIAKGATKTEKGAY